MTLKVIGAGLGRTGTLSLKVALETLLQRPCYHMSEVLKRPEHIPLWHQAAKGNPPDWQVLFSGYGAAVDWPCAAFWPELAEIFPDALIVLSQRSADRWWQSAHDTIFKTLENPAFSAEWKAMFSDVLAARWGADYHDACAAIAAYHRHNAQVRAKAPARRLLVWSVEEGWAPLCSALGLCIPETPFPRTNTREEWEQRSSSAPASPN